MSDVRLSNGSPPLERVDARPEGHTKPSVCRNLFGSPDAEEVRRTLLELQESEEAYKMKYNFDFANDTPLEPGRFEWVSMDAKDAPEVYSRPPRATKRLDLNERQTDCEQTPSTAMKRPSTEDADSDSAQKRKRVNHEEEDSSQDSSEDRAEQTPRKSDAST